MGPPSRAAFRPAAGALVKAKTSMQSFLPRFLFLALVGSTALCVDAAAQKVTQAKASPRQVGPAPIAKVETPHPILFVTQVPNPSDAHTIASSFGNHQGAPKLALRGGDLWIRYPQGQLRNLTLEAGFGDDGFQGSRAIVVREPSVHWSGAKALFSMIEGSSVPAGPNQHPNTIGPWFWQIYELSGLGLNDAVSIIKVAGQPAGANNTSPIYDSQDRILFTSDRPRNGEPHLYPQLDEYEMVATTTGVWRLDPTTSEFGILNHTPSGVFGLSISSDGLIMSTRWDHLERDQQHHLFDMGNIPFKPFNWSDEGPASVPTTDRSEHFPEPQLAWINFIDNNPGYSGDLAGYEQGLHGHAFDFFVPWQMNQDGTEEETAIHIGRHELRQSFPAARKDDPALVAYDIATELGVDNAHPIGNLMQIREDPTRPGSWVAISAPRHRAHASGQLVRLNDVAVGDNPNQSTVDWISHPDTFTGIQTPNHTGRYRNPLPLADGQLLAVHSPYPGWDTNVGTPTEPLSLYTFRLIKMLEKGSTWRPGPKLTGGLTKTVHHYINGTFQTFSGELWEMEPVEVVARRTPPDTSAPVEPPAPEQAIFEAEDVDMAELVTWLKTNNLALIISRDVTSRDANDRQQPYNLRVPGGTAQTIGSPGDIVYDVAHLQIFQADQVRSLEDPQGNILPGRRPLAQPLSDPLALAINPKLPGAPEGAVSIGLDGSLAAVVPAQRALTWQTTDSEGQGVVRERYWLTFQPGEIRTCASCHGLNDSDQAGGFVPQNQPQALRALITSLRANGAIQ